MARTRRAATDWPRAPRAPEGMPSRALEAIARRRRQMLVHCCIYYSLNANVIDDHTWSKWSMQLAALQRKYGWEIGFYDSAFRDWDGSSGHHLYYDTDVVNSALRVLRDHQERLDIIG